MAAGIAFLLTFCMPVFMWAEDREEDTLVIEVVEDIPAINIEDGPIPLAEGPGAMSGQDAGSGYRHAVLMGILLASVIACSIYFDRCEKELFRLRMRAAGAQQAAGKAGRTAEHTDPGKTEVHLP